jgi:hypothetical protein
VALLVGIGLAVGFSYLLRDRRILLGALLFGLMASHQVTEIIGYLGGADPHQNVLGETFETAVNLLAVTAVVYIVGSLTEERLLTESLADVQRRLFDARPTAVGPPTSNEAATDADGGLRERLSGLLGFGGGTVPLAVGQRSRLDAVLERAVEDARVTYPIATFAATTPDAVEVVADDTYLQEIFEIVLEQLVLYNDTSDPVVDVAVRERDGQVDVQFSHNGSGVPEDVRTVLETGGDGSRPYRAELVFVETFVSKWGGSIDVTGGEQPAITVTFATPRFGRLLG